ncbi:hypothetical protein HELRODRAFT_93454 [Helobdella robusta]|uniref:Autophagy-related protein n=1 Tax=Helobdella robusta TaxID=6412 RepID=T1G8V9_HELRO|nr:hypothetical protein HELRODRAFT_93454 [Helobdella robusta]ESO12800.1 hypothetical protein HELRODRAFT_93454 [Helobdella robusta]
MKMVFKFKEENTFEQRKDEASKVLMKYPDRIPVIVEKLPGSSIAPIDKRKFLVPKDINVAQFIFIIRKRIQLDPTKSLFLFVGRVLPQTSATMGHVYSENQDEDGFLYVAYSGENVFGGDR